MSNENLKKIAPKTPSIVFFGEMIGTNGCEPKAEPKNKAPLSDCQAVTSQNKTNPIPFAKFMKYITNERGNVKIVNP